MTSLPSGFSYGTLAPWTGRDSNRSVLPSSKSWLGRDHRNNGAFPGELERSEISLNLAIPLVAGRRMERVGDPSRIAVLRSVLIEATERDLLESTHKAQGSIERWHGGNTSQRNGLSKGEMP